MVCSKSYIDGSVARRDGRTPNMQAVNYTGAGVIGATLRMANGCTSLKLTQYDEIGEFTQPGRTLTEPLERGARLLVQFGGEPPGFGHADRAHVGGFILLGVLARCLAERHGTSLGIEHVIDDLKCKTDTFGEMVECRQFLV